MSARKKKSNAKIPQTLRNSKSRAAGMAAATRGRAKVIEEKTQKPIPAKKQIQEQFEDLDDKT